MTNTHEDLCPARNEWIFEMEKPKAEWSMQDWQDYHTACQCWLIRKVRGAHLEQLTQSVAVNCLRDKHKTTVHFLSNETQQMLCDSCTTVVNTLRAAEVTTTSPLCFCARCLNDRAAADRAAGAPFTSAMGSLGMMVLCETCGNKRCPHATFHEHACTGSNEPNQPGSAYFFGVLDD